MHLKYSRVYKFSYVCTGRAEFASGNSASVINTLSGDNVELDTRIKYIGSGSSQKNQTITLLQLFKVIPGGTDKLVYFCINEGSSVKNLCHSTGTFFVQQGLHKFDISLVIMNVSKTDAATYVARVEVLNPGVSSRSYIRKNFTVNVHGEYPIMEHSHVLNLT